MANDYKSFLAAEILSESKIVSYRILSRELKVHCNTAKKMLYDFHHTQNTRKPGSVHATYLLYGTMTAKPAASEDSQKDGEDAYMQSSPFMSSSMPQEESVHEASPVKLVTLAKEEDLEAAKARYDEIPSIHIYSLEPSTLQNIHILADCNRRLKVKHANEDPLEYNKHYGTILNPNVKRRTGRRPPPAPAIASNKPVEPPTKPASSSKATTQPSTKASSPPTQSKVDTKSTISSSSKTDTKSSTSKTSSQKPPPLKKESSSIFASFAKTKTQPTAKLTRNDTNTSTISTSQPAQEDTPMKDASSESEHEEDFMPTTTSTTTSKPPRAKKPTKAEREATLKKMMDEESSTSSEAAAPTPPPEPSTLENPPAPKAETPEPTPTVSGGRRRGRRRIMKKKTTKDEDGYLVTKEEPAWESFSESEREAPAKRVQMPASSSTASQKGGKKGAAAGKQGQGSIMSFFGKK